MDVLLVTPELGPFARTGRAADAVAALSKTLVQNGYGVTIAAPRYSAFEDSGLLMARRLTPLDLPDGASVTVFDGQLSSGAKIVLFDRDGLYAQPGVYAHDDEPFPDNAERFGLLCQAAAALVGQRREAGQAFDAVHAFDWAAAPTLALLGDAGDASAPRRVLSVTRFAREGEFPLGKASAVGLSREAREPFVVSRKLSFLAMGTRTADAVVVGSPTVAADLSEKRVPDPTRVLQECAERLTGVVDGIDYSTFNPATDTALKSRYDAEDVGNKGTCKTDAVRKHGLALDVARPLVLVLVETADEAKTVGTMADELTQMDASLLVSGREASALSQLVGSLGERAAIVASADGPTLRRLASGADIALFPSRYSHHADAVRIAQRYGAVPVSFAAGSVVDAVVDADELLQTGTGFLARADGTLVAPLRRALAAYASDRWPGFRRRVMRLDLGWDRPGRRYAQLYRPPRPSLAVSGS